MEEWQGRRMLEMSEDAIFYPLMFCLPFLKVDRSQGRQNIGGKKSSLLQTDEAVETDLFHNLGVTLHQNSPTDSGEEAELRD